MPAVWVIGCPGVQLLWLVLCGCQLMDGSVKYVPQRFLSPFGLLRICMGWQIVLAWQKCIQALIRSLWTGSETSEVLCFYLHATRCFDEFSCIN